MKALVVATAAAAGLVLASPAMASEALAKANNCFACHSIDKKVVGPAYKDVAAKFAGQPGAADMLAEKILKGSKGVWGPIPMPPNVQVKPDDAKKLAEWILSLKK
ncbi:c-type cytochrome [Nitrogeniibacter mangrovi]|uniref:C-type cytochrome n=1 Tax=Nitrogeniibacter mangrovi TaxID=2016596 RepID=A0A6C1AZU2_9RHOO|nr:c-type cytochrome [Nitrogeniibacter mangrovi]QID16876.1 c-type cytochrome [Nitrogeniibacter mangrovi]